MDDIAPHLSIVILLNKAAATLAALHHDISMLKIKGGHEKAQSVIRDWLLSPRSDLA